ncbi:hypothetical protein V1504DRAFT_458441 [Lipomyces starkeyi]
MLRTNLSAQFFGCGAAGLLRRRVIANLLCSVYSWNVDAQADSYISDQKLAHYGKCLTSKP